jgi:hypothetical protein
MDLTSLLGPGGYLAYQAANRNKQPNQPIQYANQLTNPPKGNWFTGKPSGFQNVPRFEQQQSQGIDSTLAQALQLLSNPLGSQGSQQLQNDFYSNVVPGLAERFAGMGSGSGALRSSAYQGSLGQAGANLQSLLGQQGFNQGLQLLQHGLTPKYDTAHLPGQGALGGLLSPELVAALTKLLAMAFV